MKGSFYVNGARVRVAAVGLLAGSLLLPGAVVAAPAPTGTLVGTVSCGQGSSPLANASVWAEGLDHATSTAQGGRFTLIGVPAATMFTLDAADPFSPSVTSRYDVTVQPGETLDVGALNLQVCPAADEMMAPADEQPVEDARDISVDADN